jgi:hypothetical protein
MFQLRRLFVGYLKSWTEDIWMTGAEQNRWNSVGQKSYEIAAK